jgi:hypothetical protein
MHGDVGMLATYLLKGNGIVCMRCSQKRDLNWSNVPLKMLVVTHLVNKFPVL